MILKRILRWTFFCYLGLVPVYAIIYSQLPAFTPGIEGCYFADGVVPHVVCRGFEGKEVAAWLLNFPYEFAYAPLFGVYFFSMGRFDVAFLLLAETLLIYVPFVYLVIWVRSKMR